MEELRLSASLSPQTQRVVAVLEEWVAEAVATVEEPDTDRCLIVYLNFGGLSEIQTSPAFRH